MKRTLLTLALLCLCLTPYVSAQNTDAASDRVVVVGNPGQPVQWNHRGNIQEAINRAKPNGTVIIPSSYAGTDCSPISNCNPGSVIVIDWRTGGGSSSLECLNTAAVYIFNGTATICDSNFRDDGNGNVTVASLAAVGLTISGSAQFILGARLGPLTFANLGTPADGTYVYCLDCQLLDPCLGGGTGAFARRVNSTWLCAAGGGGGGSTTPGGSNTAIQVNDNGVMNGFVSAFAFNKNTNTITLPDGSLWSPSGLNAPSAVFHVDSTAGNNHAFIFRSVTNGQVCLQGGGVGFSSVCVAGDTYLGIPPLANITAGDASSHYVALNLVSFGNSSTDQLGYVFANGGLKLTSDLFGAPKCIFCVDRTNNSVHLYGPLYLPDGAGTGNSAGVLGAVPVSQGTGTPVKWSSDLTGVFAQVGTAGSCAGVTVTAAQDAFCFQTSAIQASFAGAAFQNIVLANNIPAAGITGTIEPAQIDLSNPGGLGGLYEPLNAIAQYNIPEGGAANAGLQTGPFNDASDNIVSALKPIDLAAKSLGSDFPNCAATGTTLNKLVKTSSSAGATCAVIASIADTQGEIGVCAGRCGTTGTALVANTGQILLVMDGATTVNDWVVNSPSVAGDGRDTGSTTCPTSGVQVIGRVLSTNGAGGTYNVQLGGCNTAGGAGGGGGSPGGANGQIQYNNTGAFAGFTASGDATITPSTGVVVNTGLNGTNLAGLATGLLSNTTGTGVPSVVTAIPNGDTATTQAQNSNDTKIATDAYADAVIAKPLFTGNSAVNTVFVTSDFTTSASAQTAITGLKWTLPANTAANYNFECMIWFTEATSATTLTWSINDVSVAPSNMAGFAMQESSTNAANWRTFVGVSSTGSQTIAANPPNAAATNLGIWIKGFTEQPSNASTSDLRFEVGVGGGTNILTIKRGSNCRLSQ